MEKVRLSIDYEHPTFREDYPGSLKIKEDLEYLAKSADGIEAVTLARGIQPDVVIIDISMSYLNGIEATKQIKVGSPDTTVLMVSAFEYQSYILSFSNLEQMGIVCLTSELPTRSCAI